MTWFVTIEAVMTAVALVGNAHRCGVLIAAARCHGRCPIWAVLRDRNAERC